MSLVASCIATMPHGTVVSPYARNTYEDVHPAMIHEMFTSIQNAPQDCRYLSAARVDAAWARCLRCRPWKCEEGPIVADGILVPRHNVIAMKFENVTTTPLRQSRHARIGQGHNYPCPYNVATSCSLKRCHQRSPLSPQRVNLITS